MPRDAALIYPPKPLAPLLPAATVLLLRDTEQGLQVLMTRRSMLASFAPGAYVFPGGGIEPDDLFAAANMPPAPTEPAQAAIKTVAFREKQEDRLRAWALAAIRESFEEVGIVLARDAQGAWCNQELIDALDRKADFYVQMREAGLTLAADEVYLLAHWTTDRDMNKRFDVPFLVARVPQGQTPVADETEQFAPEWVRPADALQRRKDGDFPMIFPTVRTLQYLTRHTTVDTVLAACASGRPRWTSCPRAGLLQGKEKRLMEHEPAFGEVALVAPYGQIAHALDWQHEKPVPLLKHVMRLTAPNPGFMTGPGTNTYIIGTEQTGYLVVDPGPDVQAHIERIMACTKGDINAIICTHSHADHSPAAKPLQALVAESSNTVPGELTGEYARHICPIVGMASRETARARAVFVPDVELFEGANEGANEDGKSLQIQELSAQYLRPLEPKNSLKFTLQAVHTPGHASNHLCLILPEDGLLFSGDHVLNGSTTVIDPPDGDMTAYLNSLDNLSALCEQHDLRFILPAHGYVLSACDPREPKGTSTGDARGGAARAIAQLKAHRMKREAKVIAAMQAKPGADIEELLPLAYDDVDAKLWPVAARSLTAHVQRIKQLGLA